MGIGLAAEYLVPTVIGSLIGGATNFLAIVMLFRPYQKKKIGSVGLPFTPGVVPKRQPELAKSIGKAVAGYLIPKEELERALERREIQEAIRGNTTEILEGLLSRPFRDIASELASCSWESVVDTAWLSLERLIHSDVSRPELEKALGALFDTYFVRMKEKRLSTLLGENGPSTIAQMVRGLIQSTLRSEEVREKIFDAVEKKAEGLLLDERPISDKLDPAWIPIAEEKLVGLLTEQSPIFLRRYLESPKTREWLRNKIEQIRGTRIFVKRWFIPSAETILDEVSTKAPEIAEEMTRFLQSDEFRSQIRRTIAQLLDKPLRDVLKGVRACVKSLERRVILREKRLPT